MAFGQILGGILSGLGGLFGDEESFNRDSTITTEASATDLSPELLEILESLFSSQVGGGGFGQATEAMGDRLGQLTDMSRAPRFNVDEFVSGIVDRAASTAGLDLEQGINSLGSTVGGSETGNSMSALLGNRLRTNTASNIAGAASEARATGEGIRLAQDESLTSGISQLSGGLRDSILGLIGATRGARRHGTSTTREKTTGSGRSGGGLGGFFDGLGGFFGD